MKTKEQIELELRSEHSRWKEAERHRLHYLTGPNKNSEFEAALQNSALISARISALQWVLGDE